MARKDITVVAEPRSTRGKNEARRTRVGGMAPAVLYGAGGDSVAISVNPKDVRKILHSKTGHNTIFDVAVTGGEKVPVSAAAMAKRRQTRPDASLSSDSPSRMCIMRLGMGTRAAMADTAIGSVGPTAPVPSVRVSRTRDGAVLWSGEQDKGHFEELSRFGDAIAKGGESPISFDELVETSAVALQVEDALMGRALVEAV